MSGKFVFTAAVLSIFVMQSTVLGQGGNNKLVQQVIDESSRLGMAIDPSQIGTTFINNDDSIAFIPLITNSILRVTSQQLKQGAVYTTLQCMTTKKLNGCYRVRITDIFNGGSDLALALVDANGNTVATTQVSSIEKHQVLQSTIVMLRGPMDLFVDGGYSGKFAWVTVYIP